MALLHCEIHYFVKKVDALPRVRELEIPVRCPASKPPAGHLAESSIVSFLVNGGDPARYVVHFSCDIHRSASFALKEKKFLTGKRESHNTGLWNVYLQ